MSNDLRTPGLDSTDRAILRALARDGRLPNNALAEQVGIAPSTCLGRVRALRESGVLRGVHAEVDLSAVGRPLQAMIAVQLRAHTRDQVAAFRGAVATWPGVVAIFRLAGPEDCLIHVAMPSPDALRDFVYDNLIGHPAVRHTETNLIFEHVRGEPAW